MFEVANELLAYGRKTQNELQDLVEARNKTCGNLVSDPKTVFSPLSIEGSVARTGWLRRTSQPGKKIETQIFISRQKQDLGDNRTSQAE